MFETALPDEFDRRIAEVVPRERRIHAVDLCGIDQPLHMLREAKHGRSATRLIAANALENARAIIDDVRHHMDAGVVPINELAILPNLRRDLHRFHIFSGHSG